MLVIYLPTATASHGTANGGWKLAFTAIRSGCERVGTNDQASVRPRKRDTMNTNLRNFAIWVVIVLSIVALVNLFQSNQLSGRRGSEISYSELLAGVESGAITEVEIRGHRISGTDRNKGSTFTAGVSTAAE